MKLAIEMTENKWSFQAPVYQSFESAFKAGDAAKLKFVIAPNASMLQQMVDYECQSISFGAFDEILKLGRGLLRGAILQGMTVEDVYTVIDDHINEIEVSFLKSDIELYCRCVRLSGLAVSLQNPNQCAWEAKPISPPTFSDDIISIAQYQMANQN